MEIADRGLKHVCPECETKYYDLKRKVFVCPKCGAKPAPPKARAASRPASKPTPSVFRRYP